MSTLYDRKALSLVLSSYGVDFDCCSFSGIRHAKATVGGTSDKTGEIRAFLYLYMYKVSNVSVHFSALPFE